MTTYVRTYTTPNRTRRRHSIRVIVVHATAGGEAGALAWLCNPASKVSADFVIAKSGVVYQLHASLDAWFTWHAGRSAWRGQEIWTTTASGARIGTLNPVSVGIELVNRNDGQDPYPPAQIAALTDVTRQLMARYTIPLAYIARHCDVSPGRKTDPRGFPWHDWLAHLTSGK